MQFGGGQQVEVHVEEQWTSQFLLDAAHHLATRDIAKSKPDQTGLNIGDAGLKPGGAGLKAREAGFNPHEAGLSSGEAGLCQGEAGLNPGEAGLNPCQVGSNPGERLARDYIRHLRADVEFRLDLSKSLPETSVCRHCSSMFRPGHNCRVRVRPRRRRRGRDSRSGGKEAAGKEHVGNSRVMETGDANGKTPPGSVDRGSAALVITCGLCGEVTRVPFPETLDRRGAAKKTAATESGRGRAESSAVDRRRDKLRKLLAKSASTTSAASSTSLLERFLN